MKFLSREIVNYFVNLEKGIFLFVISDKPADSNNITTINKNGGHSNECVQDH
jgi:hypothetical protein